MSSLAPRYFLYAEDDPDDQLMFREVIAEIDQQTDVVLCDQGLQLIQFLEALRPDQPLPCCIVLDINMPLWNGPRTLQALKNHPRFRELPTVMLTTSQSPHDKQRCLALGANAFLTKPVTKKDFLQLADELSLFCDDQKQSASSADKNFS